MRKLLILAAFLLITMPVTLASAQEAEQEVVTLPEEISLALKAAATVGDTEELSALLAAAIEANPSAAGLLMKAVVAVQPETGIAALRDVMAQVSNSGIANKGDVMQQIVQGAAQGGIAAKSGGVELTDDSNAVTIQSDSTGESQNIESTAELVKDLMAATIAGAADAFGADAAQLKEVASALVSTVLESSGESSVDSQALVQAVSEGAVAGAADAGNSGAIEVQSLVTATSDAIADSILEAAATSDNISIESAEILMDTAKSSIVEEVGRIGASDGALASIAESIDETFSDSVDPSDIEVAGDTEEEVAENAVSVN